MLNKELKRITKTKYENTKIIIIYYVQRIVWKMYEEKHIQQKQKLPHFYTTCECICYYVYVWVFYYERYSYA